MFAEVRKQQVVQFLVGFALLFLYVQSLLMGLNRENGNDLTEFLFLSRTLADGNVLSDFQRGLVTSLFPPLLLTPFAYLPSFVLHSIWFPVSAWVFISGMAKYQQLHFGRFTWGAFLLVLLPFIEIFQSHALNGRLLIIPIGLLLYSSVKEKEGKSNQAIIFLGLAMAMRLELVVILPFFFLNKAWRTAVGALGVAFVLAFLLPMLFYDNTSALYRQFASDWWTGFGSLFGGLNPLVSLLTCFMPYTLILVYHFRSLRQNTRDRQLLPLYMATMPFVSTLIFQTFTMLWLWPTAVMLSNRIIAEGKKGLSQPIVWIYSVSIAVYAYARTMGEPKSGYLFVAGLLLIAGIVLRLRGQTGMGGDL